jgi:hypothetical protein
MIIENSKTYNVDEVEGLFFRPSFCGKNAEEMGIRVLYNMPIPTKIPTFGHNYDVLRNFSSGWQGGCSANWDEKEIDLKKLKAESSYSAESYFSSVYDLLTCSADINLGDLTGTDLEKAETELFRRAIVESIYATMWFGDEEAEVSDLTSFTGFLRKIIDIVEVHDPSADIVIEKETPSLAVQDILHDVWVQANDELKGIASEGNLVYFVSSDIYDAYQFLLDQQNSSSAFADTTNGRPSLSYHGIPIVEVPSQKYELYRAQSFCILTGRRNFVLALNTVDSPEKEIKMWYNPDEMENRQRVVFLAGTTILDDELISGSIYDAPVTLTNDVA